MNPTRGTIAATPLTAAQLEVYRDLALGKSASEISRDRGIAFWTVRNHMRQGYARLRELGVRVDTVLDVFRWLGWLQVPPR